MKSIRSTNLKLLLISNGIFTIVSSALLILFHSDLQMLYMISNPLVLWILSSFLFLYALYIFWETSKGAVSFKSAYFFIVSDFIWVVGSIILLVLLKFTFTGVLLISFVAFIVGTFGFLQLMAIRSR